MPRDDPVFFKIAQRVGERPFGYIRDESREFGETPRPFGQSHYDEGAPFLAETVQHVADGALRGDNGHRYPTFEAFDKLRRIAVFRSLKHAIFE